MKIWMKSWLALTYLGNPLVSTLKTQSQQKLCVVALGSLQVRAAMSLNRYDPIFPGYGVGASQRWTSG